VSLESALGGNLTLVFFLLVPGLIMMKVHDLLVPGPRRDFSRAVLEVAVCGAINYALMLWAFVRVAEPKLANEHPVTHSVCLVALLFVVPIIWPCVWVALTKLEFVRRRIVPAVAKPWDDFFFKSQKRGHKYRVIVHLKDGKRVVGKYGKRSYASTGRVPEELYLEELFEVQEDGGLKKIGGTKGALFVQGSIEMLELFAVKGEKEDGEK